MKRKWAKCIPAFIITASLLTGCGAGGSSSSTTADKTAPQEAPVANGSSWNYDSGVGVASDNYGELAEEAGVVDSEAVADREDVEREPQTIDGMTLLEEKLVYHCNLDIETLDYPAAIASIKETIAKYGGVIQSESESDSGHNWYYADYRKTNGTMHNYLAVRIPSKDYNNFLAELDGVGKIISKSTSVDNISQKYYDTTAQIEALKIQEKNLLTMLEKCETIEDMITVEQRLSEVQYELNNLQTTRRYMDMDVAYSYVNINVSEVMEYRQDSEPVRKNTFIDRLKNTILSTGRGFLSFLELLLFLFIGLMPYIAIAAVVYLLFFRKKVRALREKKRAESGAPRQSALRLPPYNPDPDRQTAQNPNWQLPPQPETQNYQCNPNDQLPAETPNPQGEPEQ